MSVRGEGPTRGEVREVVRTHLTSYDIEPARVVDEAVFGVDLAVDSLAMQTLAQELEDAFGVEISASEAASLTSVGLTIDFVCAALGGRRTVEASPVLDWLDAPRPDRGIRFADERDGWTQVGYPELAAMAGDVAAAVAGRTEPGAVVTVLLPTTASFVAAFFGVQRAGRIPSVVPPPGASADREAYEEHLARLLRVADPALVITDPEHAPVVERTLRRAERDASVLLADRLPAQGPGDVHVREERAPLALLQFTSGSSGAPKGVRIGWEALASALTGVATCLGLDRDAHMASWLPLHHDMGLIGSFLTTVAQQAQLSCMRPEQFIRRPVRWLECMGRGDASVTLAPAFAFGYIASRVPAEQVAGMDLSGWRRAGLGAERLDGGALARFARRFEPYGFDPRTYCPGYGLAEATLGVTGSDPGQLPLAFRLRSDRLELGQEVEGELGTLADVDPADDGPAWLVGSGRALPGCDVRVVDAERRPLRDGHLGEVVVTGRSVASGYTEPAAGGTAFAADGGLQTGDAGFLLDGELFVLGRMGDAVSVRGRTVYLEDVEAALTSVPGLPAGRFAVIAGNDEVVLLVEAEEGPWAPTARAVLARHVGSATAVRIRLGGRGAVRRTSSGKPRRRRMWEDLVAGRLPGRDLL